MTASALAERLIELHSGVASGLPGASTPEISSVRDHAIDQFRLAGLPRMTDEGWRYTNVRALEKSPFAFAGASGELSNEDVAKIAGPCDSHRMVFVDGWFSARHSAIDRLPDGVHLNSLAATLSGSADDLPERLLALIVARLRAQAEHPEHGFLALHAAYSADGAIIRLDEGAKPDKPVELVHISSRQAGQAFSNAANFLIAAPSSEAEIVERFVSVDETDHMTVVSFSGFLDDRARIEHCRVQNESAKAFHIGMNEVEQSADSSYRMHAHAFGASLSRHDVTQRMSDERSTCELNGLYIGNGDQHLDSYTNIIHDCSDATSHEFYKGILDGRSRSVFHGRILVKPDAQRTDAQQQNRNLLLSDGAQANTKPQLEIYADDVKCAHGATVGQLDENAVFYLRARGLDEAQARALLTEAFASEIVDRIEIEPMRDYVEQLVRDKLSHPDGIRAAA